MQPSIVPKFTIFSMARPPSNLPLQKIARFSHQKGLIRFATLCLASLTMVAQAPLHAQPQPLPQPLALPTYRQPGVGRPTISVPEFKNTITGNWWWQGPVAQDLAHALANEIAASGDVTVVERRNIDQVLSEQELANLGIVRKDSASAARRGELKGARYIILGTLSSYDSTTNEESSGSSFGFLGFGNRKKNIVKIGRAHV